MNIKDLLVPVTLALTVTLGIQFYLSRTVKKEAISQAGQMYEIKHEAEASKPLKWTVDFNDKTDKAGQETLVKTSYGSFTFTTAGGALEKAEVNHNNKMLTFIDAHAALDKGMLVAFEEHTPYYFKLADQSDNADNVTLHYQASFSGGILNKFFTINKHAPQIDLNIKLDVPQDYKATRKLRIFYPAPHIHDSAQEIVAFVQDPYNPQLLKTLKKEKEFLNRTWRNLTSFGLADRFFVSGMTRDEDNFIYRGAFNQLNGVHAMVTQLESNEIKESGEWSLRFYFGPKELSLMTKVDPRLEKLLDFGIWGFFAKFMLQLLNWIYQYVKNYGVAIILLTLLVRLILMPFTLKGQQGLEKTQELARKQEYLKQKYRHDPERLKQEQTELVRTHGVGGMLGGCLPMLLQVPVFLSLNTLLRNSIEMYNAKFLWIRNLAQPDPYYILPLLAGVLFLVHSLAMKTSVKRKTNMSTYAFALCIGALMSGFPAGVVLFMTMMSAISVVEAKIKPKK